MIVQFAINFVYLAEMIAFLIIWGFKFCWREKSIMKLEVIFQIVNLVLFIKFLAGTFDADREVRYLEIVIMFRVMRIFPLMTEMTQFRLIGDTFKALI